MLCKLIRFNSNSLDFETKAIATPNSKGLRFVLIKLVADTGYSNDADGQAKYVAKCKSAGAFPIGCGTSYYYCPQAWNGCMAMPAAWSCNKLSALHKNTGWNNIVTLQDDPSKYTDRYIYAYASGTKQPTPSLSLHAVCAQELRGEFESFCIFSV